jgi:hypothetical protein
MAKEQKKSNTGTERWMSEEAIAASLIECKLYRLQKHFPIMDSENGMGCTEARKWQLELEKWSLDLDRSAKF